jgi:hypothetical protein
MSLLPLFKRGSGVLPGKFLNFTFLWVSFSTFLKQKNMVSGQGFRRYKLCSTLGPTCVYVGPLKRFKLSTLSSDKLMPPTSLQPPHPPPHKNSTDLRKSHGSVRNRMGEVRTPAIPLTNAALVSSAVVLSKPCFSEVIVFTLKTF